MIERLSEAMDAALVAAVLESSTPPLFQSAADDTQNAVHST